ncbi:MAG TPA: penicillin-binding protein activator [Gallionella sp.]|nr:penicillin-binding protein activator [Gallionella sp.]
MQRVIPLFLTLFALYACTVPLKPEIEKPAPAAEEAIQPAAPPVGGEVPAPPAPPGEAPSAIMPSEAVPPPPVLPTVTPFPHIALLLPLHSPIFGSAANDVQQGFMAAVNPKRLILPIRVYSDFDENNSVVTAYRQAIANGAKAVVGPLTRNGVAALAAQPDIPVPTLALNTVEGQFAQKLYFFGLAVEAEARQVAQLAKLQNLHQAIIITTHTPVSQRLQSAFEEEWSGQDRGILREIEYNDDTSVFADISNITDTMVFLAVDAAKARLIRPYLPNKLPIYATSQIFVGNDNTLTNYDLNGIHFVDMPWLLQPDHPAVMVYPRANPPLSAQSERLYALGIDAFRLIQLILADRIHTALPLDGVTGQIQLNGHTFQHTAIQAVFAQGQAQPGDTPAPPTTQIFPNQAINTP